jgi:GGDEF domain-containing protein/CHASE3 domain sensor protein
MPHRLRFNLETKMILGYLPVVMMMLLITLFAIITLNAAHDINRNLVESDMVLVETADQMIDTLLAQESYGRRFIILGSPEMRTLFWAYSREFEALLARIRELPRAPEAERITELQTLHRRFNADYGQWLQQTQMPSAQAAQALDEKISRTLDRLVASVESMVAAVRENQKMQMLKAGGLGVRAFRITLLLSSMGLLLGIGTAILITRNISRSIQQLKQATREIAKGRFDRVPRLKSGDELADLAEAFARMARRLARLEEMYRDASPLTRLPGGTAIENVLKKRLEAGLPVAFCLIDLDNFKAFNDHYGYAKGNEVIRFTADSIQAALAQHGNRDDFVGHIGGDDFAVISTPERHSAICRAIIAAFDGKIVDFYSPEDLRRGVIHGKNRQGDPQHFPIMTVSIAAVTNENRTGINPIRLGEIAAELKAHAKSLPGSRLVENRRVATPC